jgi:hypothetical protein
MKTKTPVDVGRLLTIAQARIELACGRKKLYQLRDRGILEFVKLDGATRVTERSIKNYIRQLVDNQRAMAKDETSPLR